MQTKALRWSLRSPFAFRGGRFFSPARRLKSYWPMRSLCVTQHKAGSQAGEEKWRKRNPPSSEWS